MRGFGQSMSSEQPPCLVTSSQDIPRMSVIPLTVFFSLLLAGLFIALFAHEQRRRRFTSAEHDSLLPLAEESGHAGRRVHRDPAQLHQLNFGQAWLTFGRLRPLHTNAVIFAFVGNMMFAGIYYSTQRLCKARLFSDLLSHPLLGLAAHHRRRGHHAAAGLTRGKEYAELIWPINIAVAVIWVVFAVNFFWTLAQAQREAPLRRHLVLHRHHRHGGDALHRQHLSIPTS
jgi:hypothetical protein